MSQIEYSGRRDLTYSGWRRLESISRYVGAEQNLPMVDIDAVEYEDETRLPLALIETAIDRGQSYKPVTVTRNLAQLAGLPCYVTLYKVSSKLNPADSRINDISSFRVKCVYHPRLAPNRNWITCSPKEYAEFLRDLRY